MSNHRLAAIGARGKVGRRHLVMLGASHIALRTAFASLGDGHNTLLNRNRGLQLGLETEKGDEARIDVRRGFLF
jgi:hypothetical protein